MVTHMISYTSIIEKKKDQKKRRVLLHAIGKNLDQKKRRGISPTPFGWYQVMDYLFLLTEVASSLATFFTVL